MLELCVQDFLLYPGIPEGEVHQAIEAAFSRQHLQVRERAEDVV